MTGGEVAAAAAAGKALSVAGGKLLGVDASDKKQLRDLAKDSPAMRDAAESYAKRVAVKQAILLKIYQPLARWTGVAQSYFEGDFATEMAQKVADIPDEDVVAPKVSVAVPAMQGLAYSLEEPDLKEMYLNLLATATDGRRSDSAHPSFAEIIKQLSAGEAGLLLTLLRSGEQPIVQFKRISEGPGFRVMLKHVINLVVLKTGDPVEDVNVAVYIDNWIRLGLITADYTTFMIDDSRYDWVDGRPELERLRSEVQGDGMRIEWDKGIVRVTNFGRRFTSAISDPLADPTGA